MWKRKLGCGIKGEESWGASLTALLRGKDRVSGQGESVGVASCSGRVIAASKEIKRYATLLSKSLQVFIHTSESRLLSWIISLGHTHHHECP